jgi:hypothetical protein
MRTVWSWRSIYDRESVNEQPELVNAMSGHVPALFRELTNASVVAAGIKTTDLDQSARLVAADDVVMEWRPIASAPFDRALELAVINYDGTHALMFPCRRILNGWLNAETDRLVVVYPTHWRDWQHAR